MPFSQFAHNRQLDSHLRKLPVAPWGIENVRASEMASLTAMIPDPYTRGTISTSQTRVVERHRAQMAGLPRK